MKRFLVAAAFLAALVGPAAGAPPATRITVLHTNDHHGRFWSSADGEYGLAARKTLIEQVRAELRAQGGYTLLLDGGDVNTGVPESDMQNAEPDFRGMSAIGYDAMAVGNHEFDRTPAVMQRQRNEWSTFPWLSANVYRNGARMFEPYKLFQLGPLRVAVLGLTTADTARMLGDRYPGVEVRPPAREAAALVPLLRRRADLVIAATHMGHYTDARRGVNAPGDVELARSVPGIDLIVGGHSHSTVCMLSEQLRNDAYQPGQPCAPDQQNGTWIVQAGDWGRYVGRADFELRDGELKLLRYALLPVNLMKPGAEAKGPPAKPAASERIAEDPQMLQLLRPFRERGAASLAQPIGRSDGKFDGDRLAVRSRPTNLGMLITTAMLDKTQADLAIVSSGGIRDSLRSGTLTYGDLLKVQPFGNHIAVVTLSGAELERYLRSVARMTPGSGAFPQSSGVEMSIESGEIRSLRVKGRPLIAAASYRLALSSFVAKGGDGYPDLSEHPGFVDTGLIDAEVLREFIATRGVVEARAFDPGDAVLRR